MNVSLARLRTRRLAGAPTRAGALAFGASAFPIQLMSQTFSAFVVYFYVDHLHVPAAWIAAAMIAHGVFNAILNPVVGGISDRARSAWGRRVPWIGLGIIPLVVAFTLIWTPPEIDKAGLIVWFLVVVAFYDIAFVAVVLNISALFPEIFRTTAERARGNAPRQLFGIFGMILGAALAPTLYGTIGWVGMAVALGAVCLVFYAWSFAGMVERAGVPSKAAAEALTWRQQLGYTFRNRAFVPYVLGSLLLQSSTSVIIAAVPFYVRHVLHEGEAAATPLLAAVFVAALPAVVGWSWIVRRTSPRTALLWAVVAYGVAAGAFFFPASLVGAIVVAVCLGVGVAGMLQLLEIALSQVIDDDEQRTGRRREGMYFGVNGFIVRGAVIVQAVALAIVLDAAGYDPVLESAQPESVALGIRVLIALVPLVLAALAWLCFWVYPLRDRDVAAAKAIALDV